MLLPAATPYTLQGIPEGVDGVRATLKAMVKLTKDGRKNPQIIELARSIVQSLPARDYRGQIDRVFHWVKQHIRYVADPREVETISTPSATLRMQAGDCDDMSVLCSALLESIGYKTRFAAYGFKDGPYSHVVSEVLLGQSNWLTLDTTVPTSTVGWKPRDATRMMLAHV